MTQRESRSQQPKIVTLSLVVYRWLLKLGPASFYQDYGLQAVQDFRQCCQYAYQENGASGVVRLWPRYFGETVIGLLAEYWTELFGRKRPLLPLYRSIVVTFGSFVLFLFAYAAFMHIADPVAPFEAVGRIHPEIAMTHILVAYGAEIGLLALVVGGLPLLFVAVKQAISGGLRRVTKLFLITPKQGLYLLGVALIITICTLGFLLITQYIYGPPSCTATNGCIAGQPLFLIILGFAAIVGVITMGIFVVLAICTSLALAVLRSEYSNGMLKFALAPMCIIAFAMATTTIAAILWTIRLWIDAPQFAASDAGLGGGQTVWVIAFIVTMAFSTVVTIGAFTSGLRASMAQQDASEQAR